MSLHSEHMSSSDTSSVGENSALTEPLTSKDFLYVIEQLDDLELRVSYLERTSRLPGALPSKPPRTARKRMTSTNTERYPKATPPTNTSKNLPPGAIRLSKTTDVHLLPRKSHGPIQRPTYATRGSAGYSTPVRRSPTCVAELHENGKPASNPN